METGSTRRHTSGCVEDRSTNQEFFVCRSVKTIADFFFKVFKFFIPFYDRICYNIILYCELRDFEYAK